MAAASGQDGAIAVLFQNFADDFDTAFGIFQIIEAEFKEGFTRIGFAPRVFQLALRVDALTEKPSAEIILVTRDLCTAVQNECDLFNSCFADRGA